MSAIQPDCPIGGTGHDRAAGGDDAIIHRLAEITRSMDARFIAAGNTLFLAVESTSAIVDALRDAASSFESGSGALAVANLTQAAGRLSRINADIDQRTREITAINSTARTLSGHLDATRRALKELNIYGFNVKIAAGGTETFVDFANTMSHQIAISEEAVAQLDANLELLTASMKNLAQHDRLLATECRLIVPHVPQRLERDAEALRRHQLMLGQVADQTAALARSVQGSISGALAAIQIGDIARQWLEHVLAGYEDLHATLASSSLDEGDRSATRNHILRLLLAHLAAVADEFHRETTSLIGALRGLVGEADKLIVISSGSSQHDGQTFLRSLELGIAEADTMIAQIRRSDSEVARTLGVIVSTLDGLSERIAALRNLRLEVQLMALNIGVRCRRAEQIGRPVAVIADEIRTKSASLDVTIGQINAAAQDLKAISVEMREHADEGDSQSFRGLTDSLDAIRDGAQRAEHAMVLSQAKATGVMSALRQTTDELESSLDLGAALDQIAALLQAEFGPEQPFDDRPDHPIRMIMERMGRSYTMVSERIVHDQFLLPGAPRLCAPAPAATPDAASSDGAGGADGDDDDGLFAEALF